MSNAVKTTNDGRVWVTSNCVANGFVIKEISYIKIMVDNFKTCKGLPSLF